MTNQNELTILSYGKELLSDLSKTDIKFVFKGGTSLHIQYENMKRISQDIDILVLKRDKIIDKIREELIKVGYTVDKSESGTYGAVFEIKKKSWNNSVSLDISQYLGNTIEGLYNNEIIINKQEVKVCNIYITFFEKLLAAHFATSYFSAEQNINQNIVRKLRHFCDLHEMYSNKLINLTDKQVKTGKYVAYQNEINVNKLSSLWGWSSLSIFEEETLEAIKPYYEKWKGDKYSDHSNKPVWEDIVKTLKTIQKEVNYEWR